jgi:hypothetical protein
MDNAKRCHGLLHTVSFATFLTYLSWLLAALLESHPSVLDKLCERIARFIISSIFHISSRATVQTVSSHSLVFAEYNSPLSPKALFCCHRYVAGQLICSHRSLVQPSNCYLEQWYEGKLSDADVSNAVSLMFRRFEKGNYLSLLTFIYPMALLIHLLRQNGFCIFALHCLVSLFPLVDFRSYLHEVYDLKYYLPHSFIKPAKWRM